MNDLADLGKEDVSNAQQAALMRLQLWFTGETHRLMIEQADLYAQIILKYAGDDGLLDETEGQRAQQEIVREWTDFFSRRWNKLFDTVRRQAGLIAYGSLALFHEAYIKPAQAEKKAAVVDGLFEPQLASVMDAANQRIYQDGLTLSARIWRINTETTAGMSKVLQEGIKAGRSAWDLSKDLEKYLGAGRDCPRWTSTRLYTLTKTDIALGDRRGLLSGIECSEKGVSYNALRLARNEIQAIHHLASDQVMAIQPWVEQEQIILSPSHPPIACICEEVVVGGVNGDGVYPKGEIELPLHVQCLCMKLAVLGDDGQFIDRLKNWMQGGPDAGLDQYANYLGVSTATIADTSLFDSIAAKVLGVWLFGDTGQIASFLG